MKKILSILIAMFAISCGTNKSNILVVGTNAEFPPFEYLENNEIRGFDIDLIKAVAEEMNKEIRVDNLSWEGLLPALQNKKIDLIISGMTLTEDRAKIVSFSDTYYLSKEQMIIVRANETSIKTMDDLVGKEVGVILGFTGDMIVSGMEGVAVQRFTTASQAIISLTEQKIDAIVLDYEPARNYASQNKGVKLVAGNNTQEEYAIAIRKEDSNLLKEVNTALQTIQTNGVYDAIYQVYFPEN